MVVQEGGGEALCGFTVNVLILRKKDERDTKFTAYVFNN